VSTQNTPSVTRDSFGWIVVEDHDGRSIKSQSVEATLLYLILQRLSAADAPLADAVEWESLDGLYRTTDKKMAENWAPNIGVRVVRRAGSAT
jgi:hypothetical protein